MMLPLNVHPHIANTRPRRWMAVLIVALIVLVRIPAASSDEISEATPEYIFPKQLHYGVLNTLRGVDRADAQVAIEMNFDRLSNRIDPGMKVTLDFLTDANVAAMLLREKKLHAISTTGIDYFRLRELVKITPLSVASKQPDSSIESYVLLAPKNITLKGLAAMAQRRLIVDNASHWDIGRIWLETVLHDNRLPQSTQFFTSIQAAAKPIRLVLPVFFGQADACLVPESAYDTMVELNPQIGRKLHVVLRSPGFVKNLICVADYLDPNFVDDMRKAILSMHTKEAGRQMLIIFQLQRNFPFRPEYLTDTEKVFQKYEKIRTARK